MTQPTDIIPWPVHPGNFLTAVVVLVVGVVGLVGQWIVGRWQEVEDGTRRYEDFLSRGSRPGR